MIYKIDEMPISNIEKDFLRKIDDDFHNLSFSYDEKNKELFIEEELDISALTAEMVEQIERETLKRYQDSNNNKDINTIIREETAIAVYDLYENYESSMYDEKFAELWQEFIEDNDLEEQDLSFEVNIDNKFDTVSPLLETYSVDIYDITDEEFNVDLSSIQQLAQHNFFKLFELEKDEDGVYTHFAITSEQREEIINNIKENLIETLDNGFIRFLSNNGITLDSLSNENIVETFNNKRELFNELNKLIEYEETYSYPSMVYVQEMNLEDIIKYRVLQKYEKNSDEATMLQLNGVNAGLVEPDRGAGWGVDMTVDSVVPVKNARIEIVSYRYENRPDLEKTNLFSYNVQDIFDYVSSIYEKGEIVEIGAKNNNEQELKLKEKALNFHNEFILENPQVKLDFNMKI